MLLICLLASILSTNVIEAKPFVNSFIEFNLPDSWGCSESGNYWTCQPLDPKKTSEVVIVMAAGPQGPSDNMKDYFDYLSGSMVSYDLKENKKVKSTPTYTQYKDIFGQKWVDSQHLSTAVPDYYTRYLATVKDGRAVLFTVTVEKNKYNIYMSELYKLIESMKMRMSLPAEPLDTGLKGLLFGQKQAIKTALDSKEKKALQIGEAKKSSALWISLLVALAVFVVVYIYIKKKRKGMSKDKNKKGFFRK